MAKHKIIIGEWVSVYVNQTMIVDTDKDIENMTAEELAQLLDYDDNTKVDGICKSDYDWTTEEHDKWDTDGEITILDKQTKGVKYETIQRTNRYDRNFV